MKTNHYGVRVDSEVPVVGVVLNTEPEFLFDDLMGGIDVDWEEYMANCESGEDKEDVDWESGTTIIGYVESPMKPELVMYTYPLAIGAGGKAFVPDPNAEYQAIVSEVYAQVLWSRYVQRCPLCSPCYPGQGDLDSKVEEAYAYTSGFTTYSLPPDVWGSRQDWRLVTALI